MAHLHTNPGDHDHAASAFIIRFVNDEPKILLHYHKKLHRYIQFGGHIETTETPWQAVVHEIREESGYEVDQLKILQPVERPRHLTRVTLHPMPIYHQTHEIEQEHFHTDLAYAFITTEEPRHKIRVNESQETLLLSRQELVELPTEKTFESVREAALFVFDTCLPKWEKIDPANFS